MKKKAYSPTSKAAHDSVKPFKQEMWMKILNGLETVKVGATYEELSVVIGVRPDQVARRMSELESQMRVFKTGLTRPTSSGRQATVWQAYSVLPKTDKEKEAQDFLNELQSEQPPTNVYQQQLF